MIGDLLIRRRGVSAGFGTGGCGAFAWQANLIVQALLGGSFEMAFASASGFAVTATVSAGFGFGPPHAKVMHRFLVNASTVGSVFSSKGVILES